MPSTEDKFFAAARGGSPEQVDGLPQIAPTPGLPEQRGRRDTASGSGILSGLIRLIVLCGVGAGIYFGYLEYQARSKQPEPPATEAPATAAKIDTRLQDNLQRKKLAAAELGTQYETAKAKYDELTAHLDVVRHEASKTEKQFKSALDFADRAQTTLDKATQIRTNCAAQVNDCTVSLNRAKATERFRNRVVIACENDLGKAQNALDLAQRREDEAKSAFTDRITTMKKSKADFEKLQIDIQSGEAAESRSKLNLDQIADRAQKALDAVQDADEKLNSAAQQPATK